MATRVEVDPKILIWYREDAGYPDVNSLPKSLRENVIKWESGETQPTWTQLRKLGDKYKRPATFFLIKNPPKGIKEEFEDYRTFNEITMNKSPELIFQIRRAIKRRELFLEFVSEPNNYYSQIKSFEIDQNNPEGLALKIRESLDISINEQEKWSKGDPDHYNALKNWKSAVESLNILIFETSKVDPEEIRGMAISKPIFPIILLNGSDKVNGRIFTLMHELVHIIQNTSSICDLTEEMDIEVFCNKVAANILVPKEDLLSHPLVSKHQGKDWSEEQLKTLSNYFGVSKGVIILRLINLKRTNNEFYDEKVEEWDKKSRNKPKKSGSSFDYHTIIKLNGRSFSRQMINAYENNLINQVEFSRYMGIKLKHLPDLKEHIGRGSF